MIAMKPVVTIPMTGATRTAMGSLVGSVPVVISGRRSPRPELLPTPWPPTPRPRGNVCFVAALDGGSGQYVRCRYAGVEPNRERSDWNVLLVASTYEVWREEGNRDGGDPNAYERVVVGWIRVLLALMR